MIFSKYTPNWAKERLKKLERKLNGKTPKECPYCGKNFVPNSHNQKHYSKECRSKNGME